MAPSDCRVDTRLGTETYRSILRRLAVTIAFAIGSVAVTAGVYLLYLFDQSAASQLTKIDWVLVTAVIFGNAVVAGLSADAVRLVISCGFPRRPVLSVHESLLLKGRLD